MYICAYIYIYMNAHVSWYMIQYLHANIARAVCAREGADQRVPSLCVLMHVLAHLALIAYPSVISWQIEKCFYAYECRMCASADAKENNTYVHA